MTDLLVCNPAYFNIDYEINPWMSLENNSDPKKATSQWERMCDRFTEAGATLKYIDPHPHLPDMVFTANAGLIKGKTVVLSNNRHEERRGESPLFKNWFLKNGYRVVELPKHMYFEGAADAMFFNDVLYMSHGFRTSIEAHKLIASVFNMEYVSCELTDPRFYHLDTCFMLSQKPNRLVYCRDAFVHKSIENVLKKLIEKALFTNTSLNILNVSETQAKQFICNSIEIGDNVITPSADYGTAFGESNVYHCDMSEFMKAGGAVKCLTLKL